MYRILIIGGGWLGCHIYSKLNMEHEVSLIERNNLISGTSLYNQNRLHLGFHYPRNYNTRQLCLKTFHRFMEDYSDFVGNINKNLYCVPEFESKIDFQTYLDIFRNSDFEYFNSKYLENIQGSIIVGEKYINNQKISEHFNKTIPYIKKNVSLEDLYNFSKEYDLVLNFTNNYLKKMENSFYELTISLLYKKIKDCDFDAITLVDGNLFSIFPYENDLFTLTDVEYTPIKIFNNIEELLSYKDNIEYNLNIIDRIKLFEEKILYFFPEFKKHFEYHGYFTSIKSKIYDKSDSRYPVISKDENIISCFTGKIQGMYVVEDYIKEII